MMRLKRASLPELIYRTKSRLENEWLKRQVRHGSFSLPVPRIQREDWSDLKMPDLKWDLEKQEIERLLNGQIETLNTDKSTIKAFEEKNRKRFFGDISLNASISDIRAVWEPARLQHITKLILAGKLSTFNAPSDIRKTVRAEILGWIKRNPFLKGPHYLSPMECGLRIPVFVYALITQDHWNDEDCDRVLSAIYRHGWWVAQRLSLYASLGNHTVSECVGLVFTGAVYRRTPEGKKWLEKAYSILKQELPHQVMGDGGPNEQSMNYHRFVLDLYWVAVDFLEKNKLADCSAWKRRLRRGETFLTHFTTEEEKPRSIGDSDDGWAVAPGVSPCRYEPENTSDFKGVTTFEQSGYTVMGGDEGITMTFDHGPLGMPPLYNHGHADALSVTFQYEGKEFLVDPGTFRYNGDPQFRNYFKGTRAHNTVTIDGLDQASQVSGFIWSHPYTCKLLKNEQECGAKTLAAEHDGYDRLRDPVLHKRLIHVTDSRILIRDTFSGKGTHQYELNYHLHPDCQVSRDGQWFKVAGKKRLLFLRLIGGGQFNMVSGQENPPFGWYSPAYNVKLKSPVLSFRQEGAPDTVTFITAICTDNAAADDDLEAIAEKL